MQSTSESELEQRYQLIQELGKGGFGVVHKAQQHATGQLVAIKTLRLQGERDTAMQEEQRQRFLREMKLISRLRSPHVVKLLDAGFDRSNPYMVLEFVEGQSLRQRLDEGPLDEELTRRILAQVLEALAEAHEHGIVHRDLKPDNIMLIGHGQRSSAKVLDFGIAGVEASFKDDTLDTITTEGQIRGTPSYMAPEQFQVFDEARIETDIYALGLILLECLTGERAVQGSNYRAVAFKQVTTPVEIPARIRGSALGSIIEKACQKDPLLRFRSAVEMLDALQRSKDNGDTTGPAPHTPKTPEPKHPERKAVRPYVLAAIALAALLATIAVFVFSSATPEQSNTTATNEQAPVASPALPSTPKLEPSPELMESTTSTAAADPLQDALVAGRQAMSTGDAEAALQAFNTALGINPSLAEAREGIAIAHFALGNHKQAQLAFEQLLDDPETLSNALFHLGRIHQEEHQDVLARSYFEQYLSRFPDGHRSPQVIAALAQLEQAAQKPEKPSEKRPKPPTHEPRPIPTQPPPTEKPFQGVKPLDL
ncbi:MAG: serine/threonine-protein kinase [Myxococcota bacterium]|jgi:serine/threonine protein kinase|nr:serine/threonine-protein kinase [Myxococcota bacterium]